MSDARANLWKGIVIGIAIVIGIGLLWALLMWAGMSECPMCGARIDDQPAERMMEPKSRRLDRTSGLRNRGGRHVTATAVRSSREAAASTGDGHPIVAALMDIVMWRLRAVRKHLIPQARGRVLEIGAGTGANLPYYKQVESVVALEPDPHMLRRARRRVRDAGAPVALVRGDAIRLPFPDDCFDTVVATWVLCTIPRPSQTLAELRRVLRPGGTLLFAEHTLSRVRLVRWFQHALTPVWRRLAGGCHLDRPSVALIRRAGFNVLTVTPARSEHWTLAPVYHGRANGPAE